ncbi:DUF3016 domain-containing protein [Alishewanella sp. d11]|uniref:DUF3016 domain-containing protein n=1 Tax=Alishewanella sp. d11 TaxID=3414030 RepID=UPI003BF7ABAD
MRNSILAMIILAMSGVVTAAEVTVNFEHPEKYTDIKPTNDSKSRYQERVLKAFEGFFTDYAAKVPEGYTWQVTVTDIDLAGDVDYFAGATGQPLRIVKDLYSPAIRFTHSLKDSSGKEVLAGEERLRDMGFMHSVSKVSSRNEFEYEKNMLDEWFTKTIQPLVNQQTNAAAH